MQSDQINEIATALAAAQGEIEDPHKTRTGKVQGSTKDGRPFSYEYKYADIADVLKQTRKALSKNGIAVSQPTIMDGSSLIVRTRLLHSSGQWLESDYPVCSLQGDHQKMGAAMTYARRYALTSLVGVAADEDTDGQGAAEAEGPKNGNGRQVRRTQAAISAEKVRKTKTVDELYRDIDQLENLVQLESFERNPDITVDLASLPTAQKSHVQERLEQRRAALSEPVDDQPEEAGQGERRFASDVSDEERMDYVRGCLAIIEEARTRQELAAWWAGQSQRRRDLSLTDIQLKSLMDKVKEKRDSLPEGGRVSRGAIREVNTNRELSNVEAG